MNLPVSFLQVLLLSTRNALLARLLLSGRAGPDSSLRFQRIAFGSFSRCGAAYPGDVMRAAAREMLEASGVPELEARVLSFLYDHAAVVKLVATLDDMKRLLTEVRGWDSGLGCDD